MNKISIKESVLMDCIIEAIQASLFDDGVSPEQEELYNKKKIARQNAAKKAAQTRSVNKQNKEKAINKAHVIARGTEKIYLVIRYQMMNEKKLKIIFRKM